MELTKEQKQIIVKELEQARVAMLRGVYQHEHDIGWGRFEGMMDLLQALGVSDEVLSNLSAVAHGKGELE